MTLSRSSADSAHLVGMRALSGLAPTAVALVVHGGRSMSQAEVMAFQIGVLLMRPIAKAIARAEPTIAVYRLQLATRGWNGTGASAIRDARWALLELRELHPRLPIVLVGHSMGARTCFRIADEQAVVGVVGLAPWLPADEPLRQLDGIPVTIVHGSRDRIVPAETSLPYLSRLARAGVAVHRTVLTGTGHAMLRRRREWNRLTVSAVGQYAGTGGRSATDGATNEFGSQHSS